MGGKTKQSQRTKNNVRPSSSGRSAELLSNTVKVDSSFVDVGTGKILPALFPTLTATNIDQGLSPEYTVCFKKFNKKDPITKTKALQELTELVKNGNVEEVVAALPSWAHFYQTLTIDTDRRVREATQGCHGAIVRACGRRAAPHLRRLLPAWLLAQHDEHAPAMTLAQESLQSTFPDGKLAEAISFCKSEIATLLCDNLTGNAEAMLSNKVVEPDERGAQVSRVLGGSLRALELFAAELPRALDDWAAAALGALLHAPAFWKLAAHPAHRVRAGWYGAVGRLLARLAGRVDRQLGSKAGRALVALPEREPAVAAQRWTALLLIMHTVKDWHTWLDKKDLLVKRLLDVLENGGWGEARLLTNMLLPLLANLPADLLTKEFYMTFFNAIFTGLENKNLLSSKSERQTWITNLAECLRYLSIQQNDYVIEVATYVHRTWLEKVLAIKEGQAKNNLIKHSATNMASLIKYWLKQSKVENSEKYDQLIRNFWQNIGSTMLAQIDKLSLEQEEITALIESHILLLKSLKTAFLQEAKKQHSIQFEDETRREERVEKPTTDVPTEQCDIDLVERFKHNLNELVERICCNYFDFAFKKQMSQAVFSSLISLIMEFDSKNLFLSLARHFSVETVYDMYDAVLKCWLSGDTMRCKAVVDIVFLLAKYMTEDEQDKMYHSFQQFPPLVVEWCISLSLSHPHCGTRAGKRWLRSSVVEASVVSLCKREDARARSLLLMCLAHDDTAPELMISESAVTKIVEILSAQLSELSDSALERRCSLAAQLCGALAHTALQHAAAPALLALFSVTLLVPRGDSRLSPAAWLEARSTWRDARARRPAPLALAALHGHVFATMDDLDMNRIEHAASLCPYLLLPDGPIDDLTEVISLTEKLFNMETTQPQVPLEVFALRCDCIYGDLNCPFDTDNDFIQRVASDSDKDHKEITKKDLLIHVYKVLFRAFFTRAILSRNSSLDDEDDTSTESLCNVLLRHEYFQEQLGRVLYDFVVINSLFERYAFCRHYEIIVQTRQRMENILEDVLCETSPEIREKVSLHLSEAAAKRGYYWSYAKRYFDYRIDNINQKTRDTQSNTPESQISADERNRASETSSLADDKSKDTSTENQDGLSDESKPEPEGEALSTAELLGTSKLEDIITGNGFFHSLQAECKWSQKDKYLARSAIMIRSVCCANPETIPVLVTQRCTAEALVDAYYQYNNVMLYERELTTASWSQISSNAAILHLLNELVLSRGWTLSGHLWDFTTISLCSLAASLRASADCWGGTKVAMIGVPLLQLFSNVRIFVSGVRAHSEKRRPSEHVVALPAEWKDIFAPDLNKNLFELLMIVLRSSGKTITSGRISMIKYLIEATKQMEWDSVPAVLRTGDLALENMSALATNVLQGMNHYAYKYLAFHTLELIAKPLVLDDAEKLAQWSAREEECARPTCSLALYDPPLLHLQELLDAALSNVTLCEGTCEMVSFSDSHSVSLGYLLLAAALLRHAALARRDLAHLYLEMFREAKYAEYLMESTLRLLPAPVAAFAHDETRAVPARYLHCFQELPRLDVLEACDGDVVSWLACTVLTDTLGGAGAPGARGWASATRGPARALRRLLPACVQPVLLRRQLHALRRRRHELPDTQIAIQWSTGEVRCTLQLEERALELVVRFARDHPLAPPRVTAPAPSPAPDTHWLVLYLAYQNGTLLNALKMWTGAVTARVDASPQCYICYCRMHPADGRLPAVPCHQCRNKFHSPCLRKWFTTSNKSNCPLCRSKF